MADMWSKPYNLLERPALPGFTHKIQMPCGEKLYVTFTFLDQHTPLEVFLKIYSPDEGIFNLLRMLRSDVTSIELDVLGKISYCQQSYAEALGRVISKWLRDGADPHEVGKTLTSIQCAATAPSKGESKLSCPDIIGKMLMSGSWYSKELILELASKNCFTFSIEEHATE